MQCPASETQPCPTCGEFQLLRDTVREMQEIYLHQIKELKQRLDSAETRLSKVEECDCPKSCRSSEGVVREDGSTWSEGCQICSCVVS
jgi:hypothetical protein